MNKMKKYFVDPLAMALVNKLRVEGLESHPHMAEATQKEGTTEVTLTVYFKAADMPLAPFLAASEGGSLE
jgi:hypothetical protein